MNVFTIYGRGGHLGHVTSIMSSNFQLYLKAFIQNLVQNGTVVYEKIWFEILYVQDLGPGPEMTLTFNTHIPSYIQLDVCPTNFKVTGCNSF